MSVDVELSTTNLRTSHQDYEPQLELPDIPDGSAIHTQTQDEEIAFEDLYKVIDYPDPIDHGLGILSVLNDLDTNQGSVYSRLLSVWRKRVGDSENEPFVVLEDAHEAFEFLDDGYPADLVLEISGWMAGPESQDGTLVKQSKEISLRIARKGEDGEIDDNLRTPVSFQTWIQPQDQSLEYPDGTQLKTPYGEGTRLKTQSTYGDPQEILRRQWLVLRVALDQVDAGTPDLRTFDYESARIWKAEVHHRFDKTRMESVAATVREARTLLEQNGRQARGNGEYTNGKHVEEAVSSQSWDSIGFMGKFANSDQHKLGVKVYRMGGHPADERLHHPKIEAFLRKTQDGQTPHIDEWRSLRGTLRQIATSLAIRGGVGLDDLQPDDYYKPFQSDRVETPIPKGWRHLVREANEERERRILKITYESLTPSKWDVLYAIARMGGKGATYEELQQITGLSYDYIRDIVSEFEEQDILLRTTYPRIIVYQNAALRLNAAERLVEVHPSRSLSDIRTDAKKRREQRESDDNTESKQTERNPESEEDEEETSPVWVGFHRLGMSGPELGHALDHSVVEEKHVRVKIDEYPSVFGTP